jgi:hypothetical protein
VNVQLVPHNVVLVNNPLLTVLNVVVLELLFQLVDVHLIIMNYLIILVELVTIDVLNVLMKKKIVLIVLLKFTDLSYHVIVILLIMMLVSDFVKNVHLNVLNVKDQTENVPEIVLVSESIPQILFVHQVLLILMEIVNLVITNVKPVVIVLLLIA